MKIVVLEGSPHKNGSSNMLTGQFIKGAEESGHTVEVFPVAHMDMHPCLGCEYCGMNGECVHKDDNHIIRDALLAADMVVLVTPIYYFGMSAQLKMVIDRFYSYTTRLSDKHLKAVLITTAWDSDKDVMACTEAQYKKLCSYMNFENCGMVLGTGCGTPYMTRTTKHMEAAYKFGKSVSGGRNYGFT
ncbi:flavodoxin family protein [Lachnospiraceae bacterium]|nr:flavodoxin family protein [Lachnospiraceae bacterium]